MSGPAPRRREPLINRNSVVTAMCGFQGGADPKNGPFPVTRRMVGLAINHQIRGHPAVTSADQAQPSAPDSVASALTGSRTLLKRGQAEVFGTLGEAGQRWESSSAGNSGFASRCGGFAAARWWRRRAAQRRGDVGHYQCSATRTLPRQQAFVYRRLAGS